MACGAPCRGANCTRARREQDVSATGGGRWLLERQEAPTRHLQPPRCIARAARASEAAAAAAGTRPTEPSASANRQQCFALAAASKFKPRTAHQRISHRVVTQQTLRRAAARKLRSTTSAHLRKFTQRQTHSPLDTDGVATQQLLHVTSSGLRNMTESFRLCAEQRRRYHTTTAGWPPPFPHAMKESRFES